MLPYMRWFFTPWAATLCILFGLSALLLVAVQFDVFRAKLPTFHQFFAAQNWIWLAVAMGVTKVIHEFGHGLSCKHFGGECHEMGAMLLVFTPCLYCNVSDSLDAAQQVAARVHRRGRHVRRAGDRQHRHLRVVVQRAGTCSISLRFRRCSSAR